MGFSVTCKLRNKVSLIFPLLSTSYRESSLQVRLLEIFQTDILVLIHLYVSVFSILEFSLL